MDLSCDGRGLARDNDITELCWWHRILDLYREFRRLLHRFLSGFDIFILQQQEYRINSLR